MRRGILAGAALVAFSVVVVPAEEALSPHAYFDALVARADHWKSYSLRSEAQLARPRDGGYAASNSAPLSVTYSPATDTEPNRQDAAKVVIPAFQQEPSTQLVAPIDASSLTLPLADLAGDVTKVLPAFGAKGRQIRIGQEIMITDTDVNALDRSTGFVTLSQRGAYGTKPSSHPASVLVALADNSLANQVRVPVDTHDGATWFFTWDGYFTDSFLNTGIGNFKTFQLSSDGAIWLEPQTHFDGGGNPRPAAYDPSRHVAVTGRMRSYNALGGLADYVQNEDFKTRSLGPSVTNNSPLLPAGPKSGAGGPFFVLHPNRWTRWWVRIEQRADDYDYMDAWMADEQTGPVQIYERIPLSVRGTWNNSAGVHVAPDAINQFFVEFNTSTAHLPPGRTVDFRDLVAYVRNIAILRSPPSDVSALLVRPGATEAVPRPPAPSNLRILGTLP